MIEKYFVEHCAPTLASIKTGNLFNIPKELQYELEEYFDFFVEKGMKVEILKSRKKLLVYVYRVKKLEQDLLNHEIKTFLETLGYSYDNIEEAILHLKERINNMEEFPHEIGLFLGYPILDVKAFIENSGENYKLIGQWKVYNDVKESMKMFDQFKKCKEVYLASWLQGNNLLKLVVV